MGEPIYHMMQPPFSLHITPGSKDAGVFAIAQTTLHWTIAQYCFYTICGVAIGLVSYNRKAPLSVAAGMYALFPKKWHPVLTPTVHAICLFPSVPLLPPAWARVLCRSEAELENLRLYPGPHDLGRCRCDHHPYLCPVILFRPKKGMRILSTGTTRAFFFFMALVLLLAPHCLFSGLVLNHSDILQIIFFATAPFSTPCK